MNYIIMLLIVIGLAGADYITGLIKVYCLSDICSKKMRTGGLNKLGEIVVMAAVCGLDIGIHFLGRFYDQQSLADAAGAVTAIAVFAYIAVMELVSILENYAEINPEAHWALTLIKKLRNFNDNQEEK